MRRALWRKRKRRRCHENGYRPPAKIPIGKAIIRLNSTLLPLSEFGAPVRKRVIAALLTALAIPAVAADAALPTETVTVSSSSLVGVWKISMPEGFKLAVFGKTEWGPAIDAFCRVEDIRAALTIHCPGLGMSGKLIDRGFISIDGSTIRLIWGSAFKRLGIDGTLRFTSNFDGTFFIERLGISSDAPFKSVGEKLSLSTNAPDKAGRSNLLARLLQQMMQGAPTEPVDALARTMRFPTPDQLRPLGTIQTVIYLGDKTLTGQSPYSVYDVEFSNGNLICELRLRDDNGLDGFICG